MMNAHQGFGLRPRSIGELLDLTFRIFRRRFGTFALFGIAIGVLTTLVGTVLQFLLVSPESWMVDQQDPGEVLAFLLEIYLVLIVVGLLNLFLYSFGAVAMTAVAEDALLGRPASAASAVSKSWRRATLAGIAAVMVTICVGLGAFACLVPAIPIMVMLALTVPLVYLERKGPFEAMNRSYQLVFDRGSRALSIEANWVRVLIVGFVTVVVLYVLSFVSNVPLMVASGAAAFRGEAMVPTAFGSQFLPLSVLLPLQLLASLIHGSFVAIGIIPWTIVYYDIRARHEGLDLELQAETLAAGVAPPSEAPGP
jgi:hypothetical protein